MTEAMVPTPHLVVDSFDRLPTLSPSAKSPDRIAFGSCNNQYNQNNLWPIIESRKPAAFVWGGDAIYAGERRFSSRLDPAMEIHVILILTGIFSSFYGYRRGLAS